MSDHLPSWNDCEAKRRLLNLFDKIDEVDPERRVAVFDNDGTLWCEKPNYAQLDFFLAVLTERVAVDPKVSKRVEYQVLIDGDAAGILDLGAVRIALALVELFDGISPDEYTSRSRRFFDDAVHASGRSYRDLVYAPMVELLDAARAVGILPFIVSGGGNEFVRAVSEDLYRIPPWHVVGSSVAHQVTSEGGGAVVRRTSQILGEPNEGAAKISNIQLHIGVCPILAVGNSSGDSAMLEYTTSCDGGGLGIVIDHDDAEREYAYVSESATVDTEPVLDSAARLGWAVVSMRDDWNRVFGSD